MRRFAFQFPFVFALALVTGFAFAFTGDLRAEDFQERMEDMPWYDQPEDTYKEYTAEEVRKHIPDEDTGPELRMPGRAPLLPAGIQEFLLILFLAVLVFFCAYLGYRWYMEREPAAVRALRRTAAPPEVLDLPGLEGGVSADLDLKAAIRAALDAGRERLAAAYIFAFFLLELSARELLELRKDRTAREYTRAVDGDERFTAALRDLFKQTASVFEIAVYGERSPGVDLNRLWERVSTSLETTGGAGSA